MKLTRICFAGAVCSALLLLFGCAPKTKLLDAYHAIGRIGGASSTSDREARVREAEASLDVAMAPANTEQYTVLSQYLLSFTTRDLFTPDGKVNALDTKIELVCRDEAYAAISSSWPSNSGANQCSKMVHDRSNNR